MAKHEAKHPGGKGPSFPVPEGGIGMEKGKSEGNGGKKPNERALQAIMPSHLHNELDKFEPGR